MSFFTPNPIVIPAAPGGGTQPSPTGTLAPTPSGDVETPSGGGAQFDRSFLDSLYNGGKITATQRNSVLGGGDLTTLGLNQYDLWSLSLGRLGTNTPGAGAPTFITPWVSGQTTQAGVVVLYDDGVQGQRLYQAIVNNTFAPNNDLINWRQIGTPQVILPFDPTKIYPKGALLTYQGGLYQAFPGGAAAGTLPTVTTSFNVIVVPGAAATATSLGSIQPYSPLLSYAIYQLATFQGYLVQWQGGSPSVPGTAPTSTGANGWVAVCSGQGQPVSLLALQNTVALAQLFAQPTVAGPVTNGQLTAGGGLGSGGTAQLLARLAGDKITVGSHRLRLISGASGAAQGNVATMTFPVALTQTPQMNLIPEAVSPNATTGFNITPTVTPSTGQCTGYTVTALATPGASTTYDFSVSIQIPPQ